MESLKIKAYTNDPFKIDALKAFMNALQIKFEVSPVEKEIEYDPKFVEKIKKSKKDLKEGKGIKLTIDELNDLRK